MGIINCNTGFQPLKECWLGDCYRPEFFDYIENDNVKSVLRRIVSETIEDLENIKEVLESYDVVVNRPTVFDFDSVYNAYMFGYEVLNKDLTVNVDLLAEKWPQWFDGGEKEIRLKEFIDSYNMWDIPGPLTVPPLFPRDEQIVINDSIYRLTENTAQQAGFEPLFDELQTYEENVIDKLPFSNSNNAPSIVRLGDTIILDGLPADVYKYFREKLKDYNIITAYNDGHSDGIYNPIKPGVWISNGEAINFKKYFPNWDVYYLPDGQWPNMAGFQEIKDKVQGKWFVPGAEHTDDLVEFVNSWFSEWVGFCEETVWDVNVLCINPETVLCITENKDLFKWFKSHNIEPIVTPFRHRFFWDGGLHCLTLDIHRDGGIESYAR